MKNLKTVKKDNIETDSITKELKIGILISWAIIQFLFLFINATSIIFSLMIIMIILIKRIIKNKYIAVSLIIIIILLPLYFMFCTYEGSLRLRLASMQLPKEACTVKFKEDIKEKDYIYFNTTEEINGTNGPLGSFKCSKEIFKKCTYYGHG